MKCGFEMVEQLKWGQGKWQEAGEMETRKGDKKHHLQINKDLQSSEKNE